MNDISSSLMAPRRDWNQMGPAIPPWFRRKLKRIDKSLFLQFMPPAYPTQIDQGVDVRMYPKGAWVICRKLRRSKMLLKQWIYCLTDPKTGKMVNGFNALRMIKYARNLWRNSRMHVLSEDIDKAVHKMETEDHEKDRLKWARRIGEHCKKYNITKRSMGVPIFHRMGLGN